MHNWSLLPGTPGKFEEKNPSGYLKNFWFFPWPLIEELVWKEYHQIDSHVIVDFVNKFHS
jgi:hypothetical protein